MEYVLLVIVLLQSGAITYLLLKGKKNEPISEQELELKRREKIDKNWQKLFDYNETIATRGYKDEE